MPLAERTRRGVWGMRCMPASRPVFAFLLAVLLAGSGCSVTGTVERGLEDKLREIIGPAERYDVRIDGLRARSGRAERVLAVGERVRPEDAPVVERFELDLRGVTYDRREKRLERVDSARATAHITARDLVDFLETRDGVRAATLTLRAPDEATLRIRPEFGGIALPPGVAAEVRGRLEAAGSRVNFVVSDVEAAGLDLGGAAARRLSGVINPLVDLADLDVELQVTSVRVAGEAIVLDATGDLSGLRLRRD